MYWLGTGSWLLLVLYLNAVTSLHHFCFTALNAPVVLLTSWFSKTNMVRKTKVTCHNKGFECARKGLAAPAHTLTLGTQLIPVNGCLICQFKSPVPSPTHTKALFCAAKESREREKAGHWEKRKRGNIDNYEDKGWGWSVRQTVLDIYSSGIVETEKWN